MNFPTLEYRYFHFLPFPSTTRIARCVTVAFFFFPHSFLGHLSLSSYTACSTSWISPFVGLSTVSTHRSAWARWRDRLESGVSLFSHYKKAKSSSSTLLFSLFRSLFFWVSLERSANPLVIFAESPRLAAEFD